MNCVRGRGSASVSVCEVSVDFAANDSKYIPPGMHPQSFKLFRFKRQPHLAVVADGEGPEARHIGLLAEQIVSHLPRLGLVS